MRLFWFLACAGPFLLGCSNAQTPLSKTANDFIPPYDGFFRYGSNMGWYPPYTDEQVADVAAKVGVNALRPALFEHFVEQWGYDIRVPAFQHYDSLGMKDNVLFIGYPSKEHRDPTVYCAKEPSALFANMYEPVWDNGENGTPVNEKNYYAAYVYQVVKRYGRFVKFYEVWNEPDFGTTYKTEMQPGTPGSWWTTNPDPCEYALHAPVQHYIRLLRISYEVIKKLDPSAYVCVGGIGFPSFLDVILRQTDNPTDGSVTPQYPLKGGAYFDVLSFHSYPHIDGTVRQWSDKIRGFEYFRHSDRAVTGIFTRKNNLQSVLDKYGYNGQKFPKKPFIVTECNIPAKPVGEFMGSYEAQRNFILKALVKSQAHDIRQFYVYSIGEVNTDAEMHSEFDKMGLYYPMTKTQPFTSPVTESGVAYKTISKLLFGYRYDATETQKLRLNDKMDGGAFKNPASGEVIYCLWAKTSQDMSEQAEAVFDFPPPLSNAAFERLEWDFSKTSRSVSTTAKGVKLTATPAFFRQKSAAKMDFPTNENALILDNGTQWDVYFKLEKSEKIRLDLLNVTTQESRTVIDNQIFENGTHARSIPTEGFKKGLYIVQLSIGKRLITKKITVK